MPTSARRSQRAGEGDATSVYVADIPNVKAREYRAVAVVRDDEGTLAATNFQTAAIGRRPKKSPAPGGAFFII